MQTEKLLEEIGDPRFSTVADQLVRAESVHLMSGEANTSSSARLLIPSYYVSRCPRYPREFVLSAAENRYQGRGKSVP
jgi:hypothetical protein